MKHQTFQHLLKSDSMCPLDFCVLDYSIDSIFYFFVCSNLFLRKFPCIWNTLRYITQNYTITPLFAIFVIYLVYPWFVK